MGVKSVVLVLGGLAILLAQSPKEKPGDASRGKTVFGNHCAVCPPADSDVRKVGPGLKGLFKKARLVNGKPANEANVRAIIDAGGNGMPSYKDTLTVAQRADLIAYLKTL